MRCDRALESTPSPTSPGVGRVHFLRWQIWIQESLAGLGLPVGRQHRVVYPSREWTQNPAPRGTSVCVTTAQEQLQLTKGIAATRGPL
jgi:hypothetical protein